MAERAKNLRKTLSKNRMNKQQSLNQDNQSKTDAPVNMALRQSSPNQQVSEPFAMNHGYQPSMPLAEVDPLKFFDMMNQKEEEEKKEKSLQILEELNNLQIPKNEPVNSAFNVHKETTSSSTTKTNSLLSRMKKTKEEKAPMKLIGTLANKFEENIEKQQEEKPPEPEKPLPGKLGPKELDDSQKNRLMLRMSSAKQGLSKMLGKAMIKKASEAILEKAHNLEKKISVEGIKTYEALNKELDKKDEFVLKDSDVQQVKESEVTSTHTENKNIDIASFMNKEQKPSVNDIILNRPSRVVKKKTVNANFNEEEKK